MHMYRQLQNTSSYSKFVAFLFFVVQCWSSDGYQLWVQPRGECPLRQTGSLDRDELGKDGEEGGKKSPAVAGNKYGSLFGCVRQCVNE